MNRNQLRGSLFPRFPKYSQPANQRTRLQRLPHYRALKVYLPHSVLLRRRGLSQDPNLDRHRHTKTDYSATPAQRSPRRDHQLLLTPSQNRETRETRETQETSAKLPNLLNSMVAIIIRIHILMCRMLSQGSYLQGNFPFLKRLFPHDI